MRKALVALGVLVVVLVAADFGLRALAQHWVAGQLQSSLRLEERPSVSLGGFPFLPRLATGRFPSVDVESHGSLKASEFPLAGIEVTLRDVRFSADQLLFGNKATIRAAGGSGTATLTEQDINRAFPASIPISVRLVDGKVEIRASGQEGGIEAELEVSDNRLVLKPVEIPLPVQMAVDLPILVQGLTYTGVKVQASRARLSFTLSEPQIRVA
jgi:hypothetical protein